MKNLKLLFQVVVLLVVFCTFSEVGQAQSYCRDIFARKLTLANPYTVKITGYNNIFFTKEDAKLLAVLKNAVVNMKYSKSLKEFNQAQYSAVVTANQILDVLVQNGTSLRHSDIPPEQAYFILQTSIHIAEKLMKTFQIPPEVLNAVLNVRVEALHAEIQSLMAAANERRPIGFIQPKQDKSKVDFDFDFEALKEFMKMHFEEVELSTRKKNSIGFLQRKTMDPTSKTENPDKMDQIGFVRSQRSQEDNEPVEKAPIGFRHSQRQNDDNLEPSYQIILNVETGYFDRLKQ